MGTHMRRILLVLACAALAPATVTRAVADDAWVDLTGAAVLASPGTPAGLHPFLPASRPPGRLAWPLPEGPLLVLGLPDSDETARMLAFSWDLLAPGEDLHGGYLVAAWHDGRRPIAVILADDAAALYAARFELASSPAARSTGPIDYTRPPAETGVRIRCGLRSERPLFRQRAFYPRRGRVDAAAVLTAIAGRANRLWIAAEHDVGIFDPFPRLARHGVLPCVTLAAGAGEEPEALARRAAPWAERGVRHFALTLAGREVRAADVHRHVGHLRSVLELDEIVVLHQEIRVPGTVGTWLPVPVWGPRITPERARAAADAADVPLLFVESWAQESRTPVPSRPRGVPSELSRLFEGVLVLDGPGAAGVLEDAWAPRGEDDEEWASVLLPLLPRHPLAPRAFLEQTAARLAGLDAATRHAVDWLDPLLDRLRADAQDLHERCVLVPRAPTTPHVDGLLDEPAWAYATTLVFPLPGDAEGREGTLLAVADGRNLHLALRLPAGAHPLALVLGAAARAPAPGGGIGDVARRDTGAMKKTAEARTWEGVLGHFQLAGDAHPTRVLHLWHEPQAGPPQRLGSLVLGP